SRPGPSSPEQIDYLLFQLGQRCKQSDGIEVALNRGPITDIGPGLIDIDPPINTHDVAARRMQFPKKSTDASSEMNGRNPVRADTLNQRPGIGLHIADVIFRT